MSSVGLLCHTLAGMMKRYKEVKKVRKKIIFLTLVITATMLATSIPTTTAEPISPDHSSFWVVHDDEDPELKEQAQENVWRTNLGLGHELNWGEHHEVWYTDSDDPSSQYPGEIRPISVEGWHQNTWIETSITTGGALPNDATLHATIYSPNNDYPEYFNWTVGDGNLEGAYFRIRAYNDLGDPREELCDFTVSVSTQQEGKDKLDKWLYEFTFELDYYDGT